MGAEEWTLRAGSCGACLGTALPGKKCIWGWSDTRKGLASVMEELQWGKEMGPVSSMLASYPARKLDKREDLRDQNGKGNREYRPPPVWPLVEKEGKSTCHQTCNRGLNNVSLQETRVIRKYLVLELLELGKTFKHTIKSLSQPGGGRKPEPCHSALCKRSCL